MVNERVLRAGRRLFGLALPDERSTSNFASPMFSLEWLRRGIESHQMTLIGASGVILFLALLFYGFWIPLTPGRMARPTSALMQDLALWRFVASLDFPVAQTPGIVAVFVIVVTLLAFIAYGFVVVTTVIRKPSHKPSRVILWYALMFAFVSVWLLPNFNTDVFNYIMRGRVAAVHDSNPYYNAADEFPDDPLYPYASHRYTSTPGGKFPGWMHINVFLASLAGDNPAQALLVYRLALLVFHLANIGLLALILLRFRPDRIWAAVVVYAWNPVVFLNAASKTDTVMLFYLLVAVLLLAWGKRSLTVLALGLSAAVKLVTAPLVLVYLIQDLRLREWRRLAINVGLLSGTMVLIYLPFWEGMELLDQHWLAIGTSGASTLGLISGLLPIVFAALVLWVGLTADGSLARLLQGWVYVMLFFSLLMTRIGMAWYLITFIALVALVQRRHMLLLMGLIAISSFMFNVWYTTFSGSFRVDESFSAPRLLVYAFLPVLAVLALLVRGGMSRWWSERSRLKSSSCDSASFSGKRTNGAISLRRYSHSDEQDSEER